MNPPTWRPAVPRSRPRTTEARDARDPIRDAELAGALACALREVLCHAGAYTPLEVEQRARDLIDAWEGQEGPLALLCDV